MNNEYLNNQVVDAITATNVSVVGLAPAMSTGSLYQTLANSMGMAAMNAVFAQQQAYITYQTSTVEGVRRLYGG